METVWKWGGIDLRPPAKSIKEAIERTQLLRETPHPHHCTQPEKCAGKLDCQRAVFCKLEDE